MVSRLYLPSIPALQVETPVAVKMAKRSNSFRNIVFKISTRWPMRISFCILLACLGSVTLTAQIPLIARDLLISCAPPSAVSAAHPCQWYLKGFLDGYGAVPGSYNTQMCLPNTGFSVDQLRAVVVKWLQTHPQQLQVASTEAVMTALSQAFPCSKPSRK